MFDWIMDFIEDKKAWVVSLVLGGLAMILAVFLLLEKTPTTESQTQLMSSTIESSILTSSVSSHQEREASDELVVDIKGAIQKEGVYHLKQGSRVTDLVEKAGGLTQDADKKRINLAAKLTDEEVIYVAREGEEGVDDVSVASSMSPDSSQTSSEKQINLNKATVTDLTSISGIGEKRAQDIIDYREQNGGFQSIEDLKNISGIGEKTFEKLKDNVSVD